MTNEKKAKTLFLSIAYIGTVIYLVITQPNNHNYAAIFIVGFLFAAAWYFILGYWIVIPIIEKILNVRDRKRYELMEKQKDEDAYQRNEQRRINEKRADLEVEFEHTRKLLELQGNIDQGKLNTLKSMQAELKNNKQADLNALKAQIDAMKRG